MRIVNRSFSKNLLLLGMWLSSIGSVQAGDCLVPLAENYKDFASGWLNSSELRRNFDLWSSVGKEAYTQSFAFCKQQAFARTYREVLDLEDEAVPIDLSQAGDWEELLLRLGESRSDCGCRDGILAFLHSQHFNNPDRLSDQFFDKFLLINLNTGDDVVLDWLSLPDFVETESLEVYIEPVGLPRFQKSGRSTFVFERGQIEGTLSFKVRARLPFGVEVNDTVRFRFRAKVNGQWDLASLKVDVQSIDYSQVALDIGTDIFDVDVRSAIDRATPEMLGSINRILSENLRTYYESRDPFQAILRSTL